MTTHYDEMTSCNLCGDGENELIVVSIDAGHVSECRTKCKSCGFEDYWAYGFFESGSKIDGKSKTYTFNRVKNG